MGMLIMFMCVIPFLFGTFVKATVLSLLINFLTLMSYFALNELAKDMEDPFIFDPNDLPLVRHHYDFNERLLAVANTRRPPSTFEVSATKLADKFRAHSADDLAGRSTRLVVEGIGSNSCFPVRSFTRGKVAHFLMRRSRNAEGHMPASSTF